MSSIVLTDQAAAKIYELIEEEQNFNLKLRAFISGGGCSGFQYGFTFDEEIQPNDQVIEKQLPTKQAATQDSQQEGDGDAGGDGRSVQLLVDAISFQYLIGAEIDYKEDVNGQQFVIKNPNAKTTCGCGASFNA